MIISKESSYSYAKRESGGKGFNLYLMSQEGLPVPEWRVLAASFFRQFKEKNDLEAKISAILEKSGDNFLQASKEIEELIVGAKLDPQIETEFKKAYAPFHGRLIAVRSSAVDEDSAQHSFAGQLSTYLFVDSFEKALLSIKKCWASGFAERGLAYRKQNKLLLSHAISVAVVLQEMIDSEISGVLFTCDPISGDPDKIMINSVYGVGEGLVSGLLEPDSYLLKKLDGATETFEIVSKKSKVVRGGGEDGTKEVAVANELQDKSSLTDANLKELADIGRRIERFYRFPQDIEWGMQNNKLYILQSRPVTTAVKNGDGILYIWDNSNIIESYGGITLPLTFSFARFVYHQVYVQFCEILLVPQKEIKNMDYFLRNMLGSFYGRVFYNILNWYKLTSILPGFKYNRSFMETMMGTPHSLSDEIADRIKPPGFHETFSSKVRRFITGFKFLYFHWTIESMVRNFLSYFHKVYDEYRSLNYSRMTSDQIWGLYQELERRVLRQWQAPIINDYLCMVHFGLLKKLTGAWLSHLGDSLQNDLLCGEGNLESAEPTRAIITMATKINLNEPLKKMILDTPAEDCLEALKQSNFSEVRDLVDTYIDKYGFRCMSEMKLEQKDLHQEPAFLFVCLKNYLRGGFPDLAAYEKREHEIRSGAEKKVKAALSGFKKIVYLWSLKHARRAVRNRENTRFCRTRIYGVVRKMFFGIGRDFTLRGIIKQPEDIFYITLQELAGALEGSLFNQGLAAQIELRKAEYKAYEDTEPTARFMTRGPVYWMNSHFGEEKVVVDMSDVPPNGLKGIGCCPGIVEGTVKVILSPNDNMELNKEILVTLRTDPGWIPLYPSASALLVERGGLLSHSAIVAREMGLPTVVGVKGLTEKLKTGMRVRINGQTGIIEVL